MIIINLYHWNCFQPLFSIFLVLCPPTNLTGEVNCSASELTLRWDPVAGSSYILSTQMIGSNLPPVIHNSSSTSHTINTLACGQRYTVAVAASDGTCQSHYSPSIETGTGRSGLYGNCCIPECLLYG